jgi:hypothetical protein
VTIILNTGKQLRFYVTIHDTEFFCLPVSFRPVTLLLGTHSDVIQTLIYVNRCLSLSFNTQSSVFGIYKPYHHAAIQQQIIEEMYDVTSFSFHAMNLVISIAIFP